MWFHISSLYAKQLIYLLDFYLTIDMRVKDKTPPKKTVTVATVYNEKFCISC